MTDLKLAIMKGVGYGCRDTNKPCLFFNSYISENEAALQILFGEDANSVISESGVYNVKELEGEPCWVQVGDGLIKFQRLCQLDKR